VLLSSSFLFNQMGPITEQSLSDMSLIVNLLKFFGGGADYGSEENPGPKFYWCLRDFYHDISGEYSSSNDYMESCIRPVLGVSQDILKKNNIRKGIASFFKYRRCFTLIRPLDEEDQLARIEEFGYEDLKQEF